MSKPTTREPTEALDEPAPREPTAALDAPVPREPTAALDAPLLREPTAALDDSPSAPTSSREGTEDLGGSPPTPTPTPILSTGEATESMGPGHPADRSAWLAVILGTAELPVVAREHYQHLGEFARGGLGRIVRARDQRTGRVVALKEMIVASNVAARRFAREALITANLQHPAIVPVYELGRWPSGEPFYAMKLVSGKSFQDVLASTKRLDERLALLPVLVAVAQALAYAHERHVIHRDLKPANILVGDFGETVVIDWGLAKTIGEPDPVDDDEPAGIRAVLDSSQTRLGAVLGTPAYMAPEQARGDAVDERADVYAIGAMLYSLIAGHSPYADRKLKTSKDIIAAVVDGGPTALREREAGAPLDLVAIVAKAMARDPAARYASATELADELRRFTTGQLVQAHHYGRKTLLLRWLARHRAPVIVGGVLASLLAIVAVLGVNGVVSERDRVREQRDLAIEQTARAEAQLAVALYEKGLVAETAREWSRAAMYYAASRRHRDTPAAAWAAGLAEARAVVPAVRYTEHASWVHTAAISPDGERVATVDDAGTLHVWSPRDGHTFNTVRVATTPLYAVAFSPDGSELAVGGDAGTIERRRVSDLGVIASLPRHTGRVWSIAYAPDGRSLASGGEDALVILSAIDGSARAELRGHAQRVYSVAFSDDGTQLASGSDDRRLWVWNVATKKGALRGSHEAGGIRVVAFAGTTVISTGWDHDIRIWKQGAASAERWADTHIVHGAAIAGDMLVTGGEFEAIHVWDITTRQLITSLAAPGGQTSTVAFSRDRRWLVTAGKTAPIAWDATALARLGGVGHSANVGNLGFSPDGTRLVSGASDHTIRLWDVTTTPTEIRRVSTGEALCGDGALLVGDDLVTSCSDNTVRRWHASGAVDSVATPTWLRFTALSPDGTLVAAGHADGRLALVDVATWKLVASIVAHAHHIYGVQFARDGRVVTASLDDHARTWKTPDLAPDLDVRVGVPDGELSVAMSPDATLLVAGTEVSSLAVWDTAKRDWRARATMPNAGPVWKIVFAPDGALAFSATDDGIVRIWNTTTWADPIALDAGEGPALALAISPDGARLAAGYASGAIVLWNVATRDVGMRIGGRTRERGSCAQLDTLAWVDSAHREIVEEACRADATTYATGLGARTKQRIDGEIDVTWDWIPPP